jgi:hypothetical protein
MTASVTLFPASGSVDLKGRAPELAGMSAIKSSHPSATRFLGKNTHLRPARVRQTIGVPTHRRVNLKARAICAGSKLDAARVLTLPRVLSIHRDLLSATNRKYRGSPVGNYGYLQRCEYFDDDASQPEPPANHDAEMQAPPASRNSSRVTAPPAGFIPLNPRGIRVTPEDAGPFPPTSPLLTPWLGRDAKSMATLTCRLAARHGEADRRHGTLLAGDVYVGSWISSGGKADTIRPRQSHPDLDHLN